MRRVFKGKQWHNTGLQPMVLRCAPQSIQWDKNRNEIIALWTFENIEPDKDLEIYQIKQLEGYLPARFAWCVLKEYNLLDTDDTIRSLHFSDTEKYPTEFSRAKEYSSEITLEDYTKSIMDATVSEFHIIPGTDKRAIDLFTGERVVLHSLPTQQWEPV